jgi:hypothetical protein
MKRRRDDENETEAGARGGGGARMVIAKVKTAASPSPQIYTPRACSPERASREH